MISTANSTRNRNVFPHEHFFTVPLRLHESGFAAHLSGSQFKRYITLLRLANYNRGEAKIKMDLEELEELDGIAARTARHTHTKLQEFGLVQINRTTKPFTYTLVDPILWEPPTQLKRRQIHRTDRIRVTTDISPTAFNSLSTAGE